ncbi:MAG: MATE family efflux transporter [Lachnospiraceae bacterium]
MKDKGRQSMEQEVKKNDFSKGSIVKTILSMAVPMTLAQLINVLYNIVDRVYIGMIPENSTLALTGIGLCLPITSMVTAFANLYGTGGSPLCSIERGRGNEREAELIMGNSFFMMVVTGIILTVVGLLLKKPMLYLFGASDDTFPFANGYVTIYLLGTLFVMVGLGMNTFINSQGFAKIGMMTVLVGAVANLILDPIFIFVFDMGVQGAALATVISQGLSAIWIVRFLTGDKAILKLKRDCFRLQKQRVLSIIGLGMSGFTMAITNSSVQVMYNASLQRYGGDLYVGIMTVINSVREVISMPVTGVTHSSQPILGYNYGAGEYKRIRQAIAFISAVTIAYTTIMWGLVYQFPEFFIRIFNRDPLLIEAGVPSIRTYYFGFFMMSLQFVGQSVFVGLGKSKNAVFFSIFRKVIIVIPMILLLPRLLHNGPMGVFMAEPVSNFIGGTACYVTMLLTVWRELKKEPVTANGEQKGEQQ